MEALLLPKAEGRILAIYTYVWLVDDATVSRKRTSVTNITV